MSTAFDLPLKSRSDECIAQGALTNSKRTECLVRGVYPTHVSRGEGCYLIDTRGNRYVDFICGLGSNILGYADEEVTNALADAAKDGCSLSLASSLEVQVAERVKELFPCIDKLKFLKTGTEACLAAIRVARAATGKKFVYSEGYHGWSDEFVGMTPPHLGVNPSGYMRKLPAQFHEMAADTAAVIIEPVSTDASDSRRAWLQSLRDYCTEHDIALIFDEVITGFRWPKFSVTNLWGITPDLICLGKAMGNGMPISVVGGSRKFMDCGEYFVSSTFAGERLSLAAAYKTMELLQTKYPLQTLWDAGEKFLKHFNQLEPEKVWIEGYPTRGAFRGDDLIKALFWQEACKAGLLFGPSWFFNFKHIAVADQVLNGCADIFRRIRLGGVKLEGEMPRSPFAAKMREQQ